MSPRSGEYFAQARDRLAAAEMLLAGVHPEAAVSAAYYAMLYAARAALSERDQNARTHKGTWLLLRETLVAAGKLDEELVTDAQRIQGKREAADYGARKISPEDAEAAVAHARRFVTAIEDLIG